MLNIDYKNKYFKYKNKYLKYKHKYFTTGGAFNDWKPIFLYQTPSFIVHMFNETLTDITNKMEQLSILGIECIQISPIQECREIIGNTLLIKKGLRNEPDIKPWWLSYQPLSYKIGNNMYGSLDDLRKLIETAHRLNIKVIADIVINHITADIDLEWKEWSEFLSICNRFKPGIDSTGFSIDINFYDMIQHNCYTNYDEFLKSKIKENLTVSDMITKVKEHIKHFLQVDTDDDNILKCITAPFYCNENVQLNYNCWLGQALIQLNHKEPIIKQATVNFLQELINLGIDGLRIDAASHIHPLILQDYITYCKLMKPDIYIYAEFIDTGGINTKLTLESYSRIMPITDYKLYFKLENMTIFDLLVLNVPSNNSESVVFTTTHDLEDIGDETASLGNSIKQNVKNNQYIYLCYFLQRIYNVPLVFNRQYENDDVKECMLLRKNMKANNIVKEKNEIHDSDKLISTKYTVDNIEYAKVTLDFTTKKTTIEYY